MNIIQVENLTRKFKDFLAVDNISFNVGLGEIFAFLGPNGAGKTTTIKMLTTLLKPSSGLMTLHGVDPVARPHQARQLFGIVFQDPSVDEELTAWENMEIHGVFYHLAKDIRRQRTDELLKIVELWDRRKELVKNFSGGMKRRLEIARGLLHHPKILFLDEPTLGLDPQTRNHIWQHIKNLNQTEGITVFFTTRYMEEAERVASQVAIIDHGRIIIQGSPEDLKQKTKTRSLEEAFIQLTGHALRPEEVTNIDRLRQTRRLFRR